MPDFPLIGGSTICTFLRWDKSHPEAEGDVSLTTGARHKNVSVKNPGKGNNHQRDNDEDDFEGGIEVAEYVNVPDYGLYPPSKSSDGHNTKKSLSNTKGNIFIGARIIRSRRFTTLQSMMIKKTQSAKDMTLP